MHKHLQASSKLLQFEFSLLPEDKKTRYVLVIISEINPFLGKLIAFVFYIKHPRIIQIPSDSQFKLQSTCVLKVLSAYHKHK